MSEPESSVALRRLAARIAPLVDAQDGVLRRDQLVALGVNRHQVAAQVRARRWRLWGDLVIVHRGPLSQRQRWWAAVLHAGGTLDGRAGLAAWTALEAGGLRGWERPELHVVVRKSHWIRQRTDVVLHESRRFEPSRDLLAGPVPRTSIARAAVDAAAWTRSPSAAAGVVAACVQQRLCRPVDLVDALDAAGRVRHARLLRRVVADVAGGADSLAEMRMAALVRQAGLGEPRRQVVRRDSDGRRRYLDLELALPDGTVLEIEVDGAHHVDVRAWWADQRRHNALASPGRVLLRFPAVIVRTAPAEVVSDLRRVAVQHADLS